MGRQENISQPTLFDLILNYIHFDVAGDPYNLVYSLIGASCSRIASFFGLNRIFSSASKKALLKHNNR